MTKIRVNNSPHDLSFYSVKWHLRWIRLSKKKPSSPVNAWHLLVESRAKLFQNETKDSRCDRSLSHQKDNIELRHKSRLSDRVIRGF